MTSTNRLLAGSAVVITVLLGAAPVGASPKAPNVRSWLLNVSDMPVGWAVTTSTKPTRAGCFAVGVTLLDQHPGSSGQVAYEEGQTPYVAELLVSWPTTSVARHAYTLATGPMTACHHVNSEGVAATVEPMNLGHYGDLSSAYQLTATVSGTTLASDYLVALKGRAVAEIEYGVIGAPPVGKVLALLKLAIGRVKG